MKRCYKCQKPYVEPDGPGFQEVCEGCSSYLHCCQNCYFHDPYQSRSCTEPMAEFVSDPNGMNHCEYFRFKVSGGRKLGEESEGRRYRKPDFRNLEKGDRQGGRQGGRPPRRRAAVNPFATDDERADAAEAGAHGSRNASPFGRGSAGGGSAGKAKKAREALDELFKKD